MNGIAIHNQQIFIQSVFYVSLTLLHTFRAVPHIFILLETHHAQGAKR